MFLRLCRNSKVRLISLKSTKHTIPQDRSFVVGGDMPLSDSVLTLSRGNSLDRSSSTHALLQNIVQCAIFRHRRHRAYTRQNTVHNGVHNITPVTVLFGISTVHLAAQQHAGLMSVIEDEWRISSSEYHRQTWEDIGYWRRTDSCQRIWRRWTHVAFWCGDLQFEITTSGEQGRLS